MNRAPSDDYPPITSEEVDLLLKTIREYTDTLRLRVDVLESIKIQIVALFSLVLFAAPVLTWAAAVTERASSSQNYTSGMIVGALGGGFLGIIAVILYATRGFRAFNDVRRVSSILNTLIRRASQLRDRHNFGFTQKVYVDIGLADAESVLDEARRALRGPVLRLIIPGLDKDRHLS
jgi:hypothetical protein